MSNDTTVFVSGYIIASNLIDPKKSYGNEDKYLVSVNPDNPIDLMEIERRVEELKLMNESPFSNPDYATTYHKDVATDGCSVVFSSIHRPRLKGELDVERDDELLYKHISCLGHLQRMSDGNCFISISEIYASEPPSFAIDDELVCDDDF
jgi:hypothetical protein